MKKHLLQLLTTAITVIALTSTTNAQEFERAKRAVGTYGDFGQGIAVDGSGNAYVTGVLVIIQQVAQPPSGQPPSPAQAIMISSWLS